MGAMMDSSSPASDAHLGGWIYHTKYIFYRQLKMSSTRLIKVLGEALTKMRTDLPSLFWPLVTKDHDTCKVCTLLLQSIGSTVNSGHYVSDELRNPRQYNLHNTCDAIDTIDKIF